jgi:chromosome segregation ATPase
LLASGNKVTLRGIRAVLGGGSFTSIAPLLRNWDLQRQRALEPDRTIITAVSKALEQAAPAIWSIALEQAQQQFQQQLDLRDHSLKEHAERHGEVLAITSGLERDLEDERQRTQSAGIENERLTGELSTLTASHQQLSETNAELSSQLRLLEERRATIEQERFQLRNHLDQEREIRAERERQLDQLNAELQHLRMDHRRLVSDHENARTEHAALVNEHRSRCERSDAQLEQLRQQLTSSRAEHARLSEAMGLQSERVQALEGTALELRRELSDAQAREQRALNQEREARDIHYELSQQYATMATSMKEQLDAIHLAMAASSVQVKVDGPSTSEQPQVPPA